MEPSVAPAEQYVYRKDEPFSCTPAECYVFEVPGCYNKIPTHYPITPKKTCESQKLMLILSKILIR